MPPSNALPASSLDRTSRILAAAALALGLYLYLFLLDTTPLQAGNEAMYAYPPIAMLASGDYLVPRYESRAFLEKPPLVWWIIAASYRLFGITVFAERLPSALASLATVLLVGRYVRRRSGTPVGLLAAVVLLFLFAFVNFTLQFAADAFLALAVTVAVLALDAACRRMDGSDLGWGARAGAALAFAFAFKGLLGVVLPLGAVAVGLLIDRERPVRPLARGAWAVFFLVLLLFPWHWAMTRRLGAEFWRSFYWENQFLRGATAIHMRETRGPHYYLEVLAWSIFPWSFLLPFALRRRKPSSAALGWLVFGVVFLSLLVMKREVYLMPVYPAVGVLAAELFRDGPAAPTIGRRLPWILAAAVPLAAFVIWIREFDFYVELGGTAAAIGLGASFAVLAGALFLAARRPRGLRAALGVAVACGVFLVALRRFEGRLSRFDPLPDWGERVRRECAEGCDAFFVNRHAYSLDFYSRFEWVPLGRPVELLGRTRHRKGFLILNARREAELSELPMRAEIVERRPAFRGRGAAEAPRRHRRLFETLSLVRIEIPAAPPAQKPGPGS